MGKKRKEPRDYMRSPFGDPWEAAGARGVMGAALVVVGAFMALATAVAMLLYALGVK